jgi:hypothetical protein
MPDVKGLGREHSTRKGARLIVLSTDRFTERYGDDYFHGIRITLEFPQSYDLEKYGNMVLKRIKEACKLHEDGTDA